MRYLCPDGKILYVDTLGGLDLGGSTDKNLPYFVVENLATLAEKLNSMRIPNTKLQRRGLRVARKLHSRPITSRSNQRMSKVNGIRYLNAVK